MDDLNGKIEACKAFLTHIELNDWQSKEIKKLKAFIEGYKEMSEKLKNTYYESKKV